MTDTFPVGAQGDRPRCADAYLPHGLPMPAPDALTLPYWAGLREERLRVQRCQHCGTWQFGPEWLCHHCHAFDPAWVEVPAVGHVHSWTRVWHPAHASLRDHGPYLVVLVELPQAGHVRMLGNLLGDPAQTVAVGMAVRGVYEHHAHAEAPYTLLQWERLP